MPPDQSRIIEQANFSYSLLRKALEKQTKMIEDEGEKQIKAIGEYGKQLVEFNALVKNYYDRRLQITLETKWAWSWACF